MWLDVTDDLPIDVKVGQVLIFDFEGSETHLKIMRKRNGKVWAKEIHLYTEEEIRKEVSVEDRIRADQNIHST